MPYLQRKQLWQLLHHAFEPRRLLERSLRRVLVLRIDELGHGAARRGERGGVGHQLQHQRVDVSGVGREAALISLVAARA